MKKLVMLIPIFLLSGCLAGNNPGSDAYFMGEIDRAGKPQAEMDPMERAAGAGVDVSALPTTLGTATSNDQLILHDQSAVEGSRIAGLNFSGILNEFLDGQGNWTLGVPAAGGTFTGNILIGDATTTTQARFLEIGRYRTGDGFAYINLYGENTAGDADPGFKIVRDAGDNAESYMSHTGTGDFWFRTLNNGDFVWKIGSSTEVASIDGTTGIFESVFGINVGNATDTTQSRIINVGQGRTDDGSSYIDLISDGVTYTDYGFRMYRGPGVAGVSGLYHRGTGDLRFVTDEAAVIEFWTDSVHRGQFGSSGLFSLTTGTGVNDISTVMDGTSDDALLTEGAIDTAINAVDIDDVTSTTTKGDLLVENGSNVIRLPIGTNTHVLTADSTEASGVKWSATGTGDVTKVATPVNDQVGIWTGDGTIEGDTDLTFDGTDLTVGGSITTTGSDGSNKIAMSDNTTASPTASTNEIYFEANVLTVNENGTEAIVLNDDDWASPGAIGSTSPNTIVGTTGTFTGTLSGEVGVTHDTDATVDLSTATNARGAMRINSDDDAIEYTLPAASAGLNVCFYNEFAAVISINPDDGTDTILLEGVSIGAGDELDSPAEIGSFVCLLAVDTTYWITLGMSGTWVDGGGT